MMAGNPNWWSLNDMHHPHDHHLINSSQFHMYGAASDSSSSFSSSNITTTTTTTTTTTDHHHIPTTQDFPVRSWSQLLLGGLGGGEEEISRFGASLFQPKKLDHNWDHHHHHRYHDHVIDDVKQEDHQSSSQLINYDDDDHQFHESITPPSSNCNVWTSDDQYHHEVSHHVMPVSSSFSNNLFNFKPADQGKIHHHRPHNQHHSSHQCNRTSSTGGGVSKKARVQHSSPQPALKVRKEKLGDRITALHQLVSPFGKTDTASVLSEAIGYIRFHQGQIEALSFPYMRNASANTNTGHQHQQQHSVVQERNCLFPEEAGQFLNDMGMEGRGVANQEYSENSRVAKDLRSRGLCLVPISCTENVGNHHQDNGADYWAPATLGRGF